MEYIDGHQPAPAHRRARRAHRRRRAAHRRARARRAGRRAPRRASCTATSSPRTCCSPPTAASSSPTSAWRARSPRSPRPPPGTVLGTVAYLAPELVTRGVERRAHRRVRRAASCCTRCSPGASRSPARRRSRSRSSTSTPTSRRRRTLVDWLPIEIDDARARARRPRPRRPSGRRRRRPRARCGAPVPRSTTTTLARRADVAPSIVLPAATDPDETDLVAEPDGTLGADTRRHRRRRHDPARRPRCRSPRRRRRADRRPADRLGPAAAAAAGRGRPPHAGRHRARWIILHPAARRPRRAAAPGGTCSGGPGAYTTVPTIIGQDEAEATDDPRAAPGSAPTRRPRSTTRRPIGTVVRPTPGPGRPRPQGRHRRVHVSKGPDYVTVPDGVVGQPQAERGGRLTDRRPDGRLRRARATTTPSRSATSSPRRCPTAPPPRATPRSTAGHVVVLTLSERTGAGHDHVRRRRLASTTRRPSSGATR